ncbi:MAG: HAD-IIB family hydrolase [Clostridia bacterium]|nr:HAD-IIB family hydrolase [Clostridia bacterium]
MTDKIELVACDIDNTLPFENGRISENALSVAKSVMQNKINFCLASGRHLSDMTTLSENLDCFYIACDGALCMKGTHFVSEKAIPKETLGEIFSRTKASLLLYSLFNVYCFSDDESFISENRKRYKNFRVVKSREEIVESIYKTAFFTDNDSDPAIRYAVVNKKLWRVYNNDGWKEFVLYGTNKGTALKALMKELNVSEKNAAAFGDNINDMEMLKAVRHSFAVINAKNEVKRMCKYKTEDILNTLVSITEVGK